MEATSPAPKVQSIANGFSIDSEGKVSGIKVKPPDDSRLSVALGIQGLPVIKMEMSGA
ncbi:hypothetical protein [Azohydromonas caseinilytica]|uniref:hypothetical protein n=1 Tax=Azohydromonas caseinilytica TaxID=2728836 RepID=UPI00197C6CAE|nr:hypothetical protein [Azohydromonas caseinilytica]